MALAKELQKLKDQTSEDGYLTIYLQTDQTSNDQQRGEWKIRLKNGLKKIEEYIEVENKVNIKRFKQVKKRATDAIYAIQTQLPKSIVIFASPQGNFFMRKLAVPVENQFSWAKEPMTEQLEEINKRYPKEGIVFLQKEDMYMIETSLGEVLIERFYDLEIESEDWKQYEGVAASERMASRANHRDKFERRFEANQQRVFRSIATEIEKEAKRNKWSTIYLVGEDRLISEFEKQLQFTSVEKIKKNYNDLSPKEMVGQVLAS